MDVWKNDYIKPRSRNNSIKQILHTLAWKSFLTENEIMEVTFGYNRNASRASNKKYADMLRRGMDKGLIKRIKADNTGVRSKYFYYLTNCEVGILKLVRSKFHLNIESKF